MKIKIKDTKTLKDSIEQTKKRILDFAPNILEKEGKSIAKSLFEVKEKINETSSYEDLRNILKEIVSKFDTPKAQEILEKINEFDRLYNRDPRKGSRNDYWLWEKLLKYVYNIILKASGNPSPDVKEEKAEDSCSVKDGEDDELYQLCKLLGEAHDKYIEALDLAESLENDEKISSELRYAIEDVEAPASELDFMGESVPVESLKEKYPLENNSDEYFDEEDAWEED